MKKVQWGILGLASIALEEGIKAIEKEPGSTFYALATNTQEEYHKAQKSLTMEKLYEDYDELLKDEEVEAVYIPLPNALHKEWTLKALEKGKHVLCEKPLALEEAEVLAMMHKAKEKGCVLLEGFMYRYTPRMKKVEEILDSGVLGEIRHVETSFRFMLEDPEDVRMDPSLGGGAFYDLGTYGVNFMTMIFQKKPLSILAMKKMEKGVDVQSTVLLEYEDAVTGVIHSAFNSVEKNEAEIIGTKGRLLIPDPFLYQEGVLTLYVGKEKEEIPVAPCEDFQGEFQDVVMAIREGRALKISLAESLMNAQITDEILGLF